MQDTQGVPHFNDWMAGLPPERHAAMIDEAASQSGGSFEDLGKCAVENGMLDAKTWEAVKALRVKAL